MTETACIWAAKPRRSISNVRFFIQVANNTAEISAMDTAVIAQELSGAIDDIEAKGAEVIAEVEDLAAEKVNLLNQTTTTNVGFIETAGSEQKALVTAEGVKQTDLVTAAGSNLVTTGNEQVARVVAAGDEKIAAAENWAIGEIADCPFGSAKYWANEAKIMLTARNWLLRWMRRPAVFLWRRIIFIN